MTKTFSFLILFSFHQAVIAQATDPWISSQLSKIVWQQTYEGVLADYHPVTITLASDSNQIAGYLIHKGDHRVHRLLGDWARKDLFQLQERDEYDRLTGYLRGSISRDQLHMEWMSSDQSRMFDIVAYPSNIIKVKNFKPAAEWIKIDVVPEVLISVQKMDFGIVSGIAKRNGLYSRFEGYCLDGTCSIWNTVIQNPDGAPIKVQMRQKDAKIYKALFDGKEYSASILSSIPLAIKHFDNSMGFLDFVYPQLESNSFKGWLANWIDKRWNDGVNHLASINQPGTSGRLVHRSSGWIEIIDADENFVSGLVTYINPGSTHRESFVWVKKDDLFLSASDLFNTSDDLKKSCELVLSQSGHDQDEEYLNWLRGSGYGYAIPSKGGLVMMTEFNMIYGDDIRQLTVNESKPFVKKKYWRYFGW